MQMREKNCNCDMVIYILLTAILVVWWRYATGTPFNSGDAPFPLNFNLTLYIGSILGVYILSCVLFMISDFITGRTGEISGAARFFNVILIPVFTLAAAFLFLLIYMVYNNENTLFPGDGASYSLRQYFPHPLYFMAICIPSILLFFYAGEKEHENSSRLIRFIASLVISLLSVLYTWCPNPYADVGGGILHIDAYITSIINTARGVPFDFHHISIYGHYGILYYPFVKLMGNDWQAILLSIAIFTFITFMSACYISHVLIKRDSLFLLTASAICATTTLLTRRGVFYQINPHRLMFPMIGLAFIAWESKHPKGKISVFRVICKILISVLAYVWNFETGLFTTIILAFSIFLELHYDESWLSMKAIRTAVLSAVSVLLTFFIAIGIVDLYNAAAGGGPVSFRQFIYPLFSGNFSVNNLRMTMPSIGHLYFLQILLFGFTALSVLRGRLEDSGEERRMNILSITIALSGFASLIYFVNRPAYGNMSIAFIQMSILLGFGADRFIDRKKLFFEGIKAHRIFKFGLGMVMFFALFWISIEGVLYIEQGLSIRRESGWSDAVVAKTLEDVRKGVPKDTFAIGKGVPLLYYELGWDPQIYPIDSPDINDENRRFIQEKIQDESAVFTSRRDLIPEDFEIKSTYILGSVQFWYYEKAEQKSSDT